MPLTYVPKKAEGFIHLTGVGSLTVDEYVRINDAIDLDPECAGLVRRFYDMREVEVAKTYSRQRSLNDRTKGAAIEKMAILVTSAAAYGMARMYQTIAEQMKVEIFYHEQEALDWLLED